MLLFRAVATALNLEQVQLSVSVDDNGNPLSERGRMLVRDESELQLGLETTRELRDSHALSPVNVFESFLELVRIRSGRSSLRETLDLMEHLHNDVRVLEALTEGRDKALVVIHELGAP